MDAIIYTSNTGTTKKYAEMLAAKLSLPVYSLKEAADTVSDEAQIIYLGWLMASEVKGYKAAAKKYSIKAVCGVGMGATGSQLDDVRKRNAVPKDIQVFTLQGGFDIKKLHGIYKFMMNIMLKSAVKALAQKKDREPDENDMLDMLLHGGERVAEENLNSIVDWYAQIKA